MTAITEDDSNYLWMS